MFKQKRLIFLAVILIVLLSFFAFMRGRYIVPILMYHSVSPQEAAPSALRVTPETFRKQMRFLKEHHYNVVTLEEVGEMLKNKKKIPPKSVAITFDDGYRDNYTYAYPILKEYRIPATIFIIVNEVGRAQEDRLFWDEIKTMQSSGLITLGSHALDPEPLVDIKSQEKLIRQIFDSRRILEDKLGVPVLAFSYAGGLFNDNIKNLVIQAGYKLAVTTKGRKSVNSDIFALKRIRVSASADNLIVFWAQTTGYYNSFKGGKKK